MAAPTGSNKQYSTPRDTLLVVGRSQAVSAILPTYIMRHHGESVIINSGGVLSPILASATWASSPPTAWMNYPDGPIAGEFLDGVRFANSDTPPADAIMSMSWLNGVAPDGSGMLRGTRPAGWGAYPASYVAAFTTFENIFGAHRGRDLSMRGLFRHHASPYLYSETGTGKIFYIQTYGPKFTFNLADATGFNTVTCSNNWTFNAATGTYTGTASVTGGATLAPNTMLFAMSGNAVGATNTIPLRVLSHNPSTGDIVVYSHAQPGNGSTVVGYNNPPAINDTFGAFFIWGGSVTANGNAADVIMTGPLGPNSDAWELQLANYSDDYGTPPVAVTIVTSLGVTIAATCVSNSSRYELNGYRDGIRSINGGPGETVFATGSTAVDAHQISLPGWFNAVMGLSGRFTPNNPWNLAQNTNNFYFRDHAGEIYYIELEVVTTQNPWIIKFYVTTPWGAVNLPFGTAGPQPASTSAFGGEITQYNNYLLFHYEMPGPALNQVATGPRSGLFMEWGSFIGNSMVTAAAGVTFDMGRIDVGAARMGSLDIY